jgi:RHS repeat-associated protein
VASSYQYYLHSDHLNTPRHATDQSQKLLWSWNSDAFGVGRIEGVPIDDSGAFLDMPLRFPGQYFDEETELHYNYFRDYDPGTGRYVQSDPIGLQGGLSTYAYVENNPLMYTDPYGLWANVAVGVGIRVVGGRAAGAAISRAMQQAVGPVAGTALACVLTGYCSTSDEADSDEGGQCPTGSKPINETEWSGDHQGIKEGIGAGPADSTKIDPSGNVWGENPDGTWTNHGPAGNFTGSGKSSGRKGKDRRRRW